MTNRRLAILGHYIRTAHTRVGILDALRVVLGSTCGYKAKRYIENITLEGDTFKVHIRGLDRPLYIPAQLGRHFLNQVLAEVMHPSDWHRYESFGTNLSCSDVVLDCGAAEGLFSLVAAQKCKKVLIVEPMPLFQSALKRTFHGMQNVHILDCALGDSLGHAHIFGEGLSASINAEGKGTRVELKRVDDISKEYGGITFIKADLEGYELKMLAGAEATVKYEKPKIAITTYHHPDHARKISEMLLNWNDTYKIQCKGIDERAGGPVMLHAWVANS